MDISSQDRDYLIRTMIGEADDQPDLGKVGVAHVALNRLGPPSDAERQAILAKLDGQFPAVGREVNTE